MEANPWSAGEMASTRPVHHELHAETSDVTVDDVAKSLADYEFHTPTPAEAFQ